MIPIGRLLVAVEPGGGPHFDTTHNVIAGFAAGSPEPSAVEVRAGLERILASRCFEQAARSSKFLRFVVEQTFAGQGERLKGYTIAIEVFGRPPDFDAQSDPLVRVEAGRLRRRLTEYYADEGRDDPVRIELPRGRYLRQHYLVPQPRRSRAAVGCRAAGPDAASAAGVGTQPASVASGSCVARGGRSVGWLRGRRAATVRRRARARSSGAPCDRGARRQAADRRDAVRGSWWRRRPRRARGHADGRDLLLLDGPDIFVVATEAERRVLPRCPQVLPMC